MIEVRRISAFAADKSDDSSLLNIIQSSLLGKFYKRFLKPLPIVRTLVISIWALVLPTVFFIYGKYKLSHRKSIPLKKLSEYALNRRVIFSRQPLNVPVSDFFPRKKSGISKLDNRCEFPEVFITTIENCTVSGASNFLNVNEGTICHDLFRCSHDYTSEELHGRFIINCKKSRITYLSNAETENVLDKGAVFTDAVSGNYAHFLTEVLPRVFVFSTNCTNVDTPIIIDCGLHPNLMEALEMVAGREADFVGLEKGEHLLVKSLQVVSPCGYVPFQRRSNSKNLTDHSHGVFSPRVLGAMVDFIKSNFSNKVEVQNQKKIFIKRNSLYRNISNAEDVERMLVAKGFFVVEPEKLSFIEQVMVFSNAEVVIGATGAAFANLIFCKPETRIIILISELKDTSYGYWQNMACAVGNRVTYVLGKITGYHMHGIHSNYEINMADVIDAIEGVE